MQLIILLFLWKSNVIECCDKKYFLISLVLTYLFSWLGCI
jgi:hypothetical protein